MPRQSTAFSVIVAGVLVCAVVLFHPSAQMDAVRQLVGLGGERLLPAPAITARGGAFTFAMTQQGSDEPVGWNPCNTVEYAVNPAGMPDGARPLVDRAIARISAATGLEFEDEGDTDRRPFAGSFISLGGSGPVVIGWGDAAEFPELGGGVVGLGGAAPKDGPGGRRYYVTGGLVLDTEVFTAANIADRPRVMEAIVVHELAHVVGLGHVAEPMELMFGDNNGQVELGPGDREGLARVGSLPCR
ncbi:hypothetical protein SAMN05192575_101517 [Nocardioides alpinus]|uniref:Matrixin n=1 Tax=Nocardioides alpinus TaxID=748909 RepID=A0A1I0VWL1_9ACTN|nr:hypothetical protein [Nocardioides alpinus]PKH37528.1 hypothetical protein CXG46_18980 [Nocardioides alpinus]SFA80694.1 hypothetical protein SAMN05192575_101517 [Nocardioides alpinus]